MQRWKSPFSLAGLISVPEASEALIHLSGLTKEQLVELVGSWGEKPYRAKQLWAWLHVRLAPDVDAMTDLSLAFRDRLKSLCASLRPEIARHQQAADGTEKWLMTLADGQTIETVLIPEEGRGTLCISSQAGCSLNCPFCHTGTQGLARNLTTAEIVNQILLVRGELLRRQDEPQRVTNIVLMGMGEPLYNYQAVAQAVQIMLDGNGLAFGSRKITLSTAGVVPRLAQAGRELGVNLAISLHAARDELRDQLVPLNRKYNLAALKQALQSYPLKQGRRITWEYVLLDGVNDSDDDARQVARYLSDLPSKVNLIPFNPWPGALFAPSTPQRVERFQQLLHQSGYVTVIRDRRGADIEAACGQLTGLLQGSRARPVTGIAAA
ncbi:MAG: 23S rRNA (adenine(2503)-C(2))-methyltransferase RlmN [Magnetococcales bacterium]|nr:23S rRNA (adenine(2503)-C(2))-methyltransferase RlmN [Magnetococcales bacterium]